MTPPKPMTDWQASNTPSTIPLVMRRNIEPGPEGCWLWTRSRTPDGYGWASYQNKTVEAHRIVYTLAVGPVSPGLVLDHLCKVRHCVNPGHLEPVTNSENARRSRRELDPRCGNGHSWTEENTYISPRGIRGCRECNRARQSARKKKLRAARRDNS